VGEELPRADGCDQPKRRGDECLQRHHQCESPGIGILNLLLMAFTNGRVRSACWVPWGSNRARSPALHPRRHHDRAGGCCPPGVVLGLALNGSFSVVGMDYSQFSSVDRYMAPSAASLSDPGLGNLFSRALTTSSSPPSPPGYPPRRPPAANLPRPCIMFSRRCRCHSEESVLPDVAISFS